MLEAAAPGVEAAVEGRGRTGAAAVAAEAAAGAAAAEAAVATAAAAEAAAARELSVLAVAAAEATVAARGWAGELALPVAEAVDCGTAGRCWNTAAHRDQC